MASIVKKMEDKQKLLEMQLETLKNFTAELKKDLSRGGTEAKTNISKEAAKPKTVKPKAASSKPKSTNKK